MASVFGVLLGIAALAGVSVYTGLEEIGEALSRGGPWLFALAAFYPLELIPDAWAWRVLFPPEKRPSRGHFVRAMWFAHSVNRLLPTANFGGDVVRGRLALLEESPAPDVVTSLVADKTGDGLAAWVLLIVGGAFMVLHTDDPSMLGGLGAAVVGLGGALWAFIRIQRSSGVSGLLERISSEQTDWLARAGATTRDVERQLEWLYGETHRLAGSVAIRVVYNLLLAAEVWVAAAVMGVDLTVIDAVAIRAGGVAARSMAFVVWGGFGIQEGTYALLGSLVGAPPTALVAVSLATRLRELVTAVPGLAVWMTSEGRRAVADAPPESSK